MTWRQQYVKDQHTRQALNLRYYGWRYPMLLQRQLERLSRLAWTQATMVGWSLSSPHYCPFLAILTFSPTSSIFTIYIFIFWFSYLIPLYSLFIHLSFPGPHFTLLCCPSTGPIFLFPLHLLPYFLLTNPHLVLSFWILHFISLHSSALLSTPQAYMHAHTGSHFVPATPPSRTRPNISAMLTQLPYVPAFPACALSVYPDDRGLCRWHWFNGTYNPWTQRSFLKSGEICKKYGTDNKSREDGIHAQWKGHNIASGLCNRKIHI